MWLGEMYWNPARPPRDAVSIEILKKKQATCYNKLTILKEGVPQRSFFYHSPSKTFFRTTSLFLLDMMLMVLVIVIVMPFGINLIKDPRLYKTVSI